MTATVSTLPIWKKDSTASEWLQELAAMALEHPEQWERIVVVFEQDSPKQTHTRFLSRAIRTNQEILGTLVCAQHELFEYMKGRRT